eukprot:CAMPEP_0197247390 /NCGR_PEP_ID=MMETSP1429-20130617/29154_1 /TAXON_ID=49237 /ORGANISM="Chaetoceros  sp., Strain UNC1202" /LENGTH=415 /DNA_ID=CAMNT_0042708295 /DNA_START=122 /DNA_END=1369 /DNA_ORIENTATION=+
MAKLMHQHQMRALFVRGGSSGSGDDHDGIDGSSTNSSSSSVGASTIETTVISNPITDSDAEVEVPVEAKATERPPLSPSVATQIPKALAAAPTKISTQQPKKQINPKLANAIERTGPALLMLSALYTLLKITGEKGLLYFLIPLMQLGMYSETTGIIEEFKKDVELRAEKWWWFATVFASTTLRALGGGTLFSGLLGVAPATFDLMCFGMVAVGLVVAVAGMASHSAAGPDMFRKYLGELSAFHFSLIFLIGQSSFWIKTIESFGMEWVIFPALLVVVNDTMAYVFGVLMGKNKLLPRLSPKKTVEGFIGAGVSTCAVSIPLLKYFAANFADGSKAALVMGGGEGNLVQHALALAVYTSLISPFGGFLASAVKRAHGAKDFGTLIPGHGGVVDRFDCQVVTAPFVYLYLRSIAKN